MIFQSGLGIDFRQGSVTVALLQGSLTGIRSGASLHHLFPEGIDRAEKISQAGDLIKDFIGRQKIDTPDIYLSIPRELMIVREVDFPSAVKDNLAGTIVYELEKYIPLPAADIYLDHLVLSENKAGNQIRVLLAAARKADVDDYLQLAGHIGCKLTGIEFRPTVLTDFIMDNPALSAVPFHAFLFDDGDGIELSLNSRDVLRYSRFFRGKEPDPKGVAEAISVLRKQFEITEGPLKVGYVRGAILPPVLELLAKDPDIELYSVSPVGDQTVPGAVVSAQALAMRGVRQSRNGLNLLPKQHRKRPGRLPRYLFYALSGLLLLSILSWGGSVVIRRQLDDKKIDEQLAAIRPEVERVKQIEFELSDLKKMIDQINLLQKQRVLSIDVLKELTLVIPKDAYLTSLNYKKRDIQVEGVAGNATELIPLIESSPLFKETRLLSAVTREPDGKERFRIGFKVDHD